MNKPVSERTDEELILSAAKCMGCRVERVNTESIIDAWERRVYERTPFCLHIPGKHSRFFATEEAAWEEVSTWYNPLQCAGDCEALLLKAFAADYTINYCYVSNNGHSGYCELSNDENERADAVGEHDCPPGQPNPERAYRLAVVRACAEALEGGEE